MSSLFHTLALPLISIAAGIRQEDGSMPGEPLPLLDGLLWFLVAPLLISGLVWIFVSASHNRYASPEALARKGRKSETKRDLLTSIE
ncbi:MAG: hypothetical protein ACKO29_05020 [Actinomycetota bacterium]